MQGVSSSEIRAEKRKIKIQTDSDNAICSKFVKGSDYVNGVEIVNKEPDAYYLTSKPRLHYEQIVPLLEKGKSVICESSITDNAEECKELFTLADKNNCILMDGIKAAYSTAYNRLLL